MPRLHEGLAVLCRAVRDDGRSCKRGIMLTFARRQRQTLGMSDSHSRDFGWFHSNAFLEEFISRYRAEECLWNKASKEHSDTTKRDAAYARLLAFCRTVQPNFKKNELTRKIHSLRGSWRKERAKRLNTGDGMLWYFPLLSFLEEVTFSYRTNMELNTDHSCASDSNSNTEGPEKQVASDVSVQSCPKLESKLTNAPSPSTRPKWKIKRVEITPDDDPLPLPGESRTKDVEDPPLPSENIIKTIEDPPPPSQIILKTVEDPPPPSENIIKTVEDPPPPSENIIKTVEDPPLPSENIIKTVKDPPPPRKKIIKTVKDPPTPRKNKIKKVKNLPPPRKNKMRAAKDPNSTLNFLSKRYLEKDDEVLSLAKGYAVKMRKLSREQLIFVDKLINDALFAGQIGALTKEYHIDHQFAV